MNSTQRLLRLLWLTVAATSLSAASPPLELLSRTTQPGVTASGDSTAPLLSASGQYVLFLSTAHNLVTNGLNGAGDLFLADLHSNVTQLVSVTPEGRGGNAPSLQAAMSANGQIVVFVSRASDLVLGDTNGLPDVFVRDMTAGQTRLVSAATNGMAGNGESGAPEVSADGRWIVFESRATDLVANDTNRSVDVFLYDTQEHTVSLLSGPSSDPAISSRPSGASVRPGISQDGGTVVFSSLALNLARGITAGVYIHTNQLYVRRPLAQPPRMVDVFTSRTGYVSSARVQPLDWDLSADGRYLVLQALVRPFTVTNTLPSSVYWVDLDAGTAQAVATNLLTIPLTTSRELSGPRVSADGQTVLFEAREPFGIAGLKRSVVYAWTAHDGAISRVSSSGLWDDPNIDPPSPPEAPYGELLAINADADFVAFIGGTTNDPATPLPAQQLMVRRRSTGELRRISRTPDGSVLPDVGFPAVSFSDDGMRLVFQSESDQYIADDRNRAHDVFLYDWATDQISLVSRRLPEVAPVTGPGRASVQVGAWSADARFLVFTSDDAHLAPMDTNQAPDVFRLDLATGSNVLVSVNLSGTGPANGGSGLPSISGDGRFVAFTSVASDLVADLPNHVERVFLRDMTSGETVLVSRGYATNNPAEVGSHPVLSPDGRWVAFVSKWSQLPPFNPFPDVFLFDRLSGVMSMVSSNATGTARAYGSFTMPMFSPDGRWLFFASWAGNLVEPNIPSGWRVAAHDLVSGTNRVLSVEGPNTGDPFGYQPSRWAAGPIASVSGDSRWVVFSRDTTVAPVSEELAIHDLWSNVTTSLVVGAAGGSLSADGRWVAYDCPTNAASTRHLYFQDRQTGDTTLVESARALLAGRLAPTITPNGRFAVFTTRAWGVTGAPDDNNSSDVFLHDRVAGQTMLLSLATSGSAGRHVSSSPVLAPDGRTLVFASYASDLVDGDLNRDQDLFLVRLPGAESDFRITSISRPGQSGATLIWAITAGRTYHLEWTPTLESPSWQTLSTTIQVDGTQATASDATAPAQGNRFYRVVEDP